MSLVYYFTYNSRVYAVLYHTTDSNIVNYKSVFSLVARSLKFGYVPETVVSPETPSIFSVITTTTYGVATTTGSVSTTVIE